MYRINCLGGCVRSVEIRVTLMASKELMCAIRKTGIVLGVLWCQVFVGV